MTRRDILLTGGSAFMGSVIGSSADSGPVEQITTPQAQAPIITPNGSSLPWKLVDGVKVYHLIAEEVEHEFAPGLTATCWGYNGQVHGPTLEAVEGDRIRIYVTNKTAFGYYRSLAWHPVAEWDGWGRRTQPACHQAGRDVLVRI